PIGSSGACGNQWCAALTIDELTGNLHCNEPVTQGSITTDGMMLRSDLSNLLLMSPGDRLEITILDTPMGVRTVVRDLTSGGLGFMTASGTNGFFQTDRSDCSRKSFDYHPAFDTASPGNVVAWTGLKANVNLSFEIGHWELCPDTSTSSCRHLADPLCSDPKN